MQNFTTKDLKNGMILTSTAGFKWIVFEEKLLTTETDVPLFLGSIKDDFSYDGRNFATQFIKVKDTDGKVFWEKKEDKKPTLEDYKLMKAWNEATGRSVFVYDPPHFGGEQFVADALGNPYHIIPTDKTLSFLKAGDTYEFEIDPVMESLLNANAGPLKTSIATIIAMNKPKFSIDEIPQETIKINCDLKNFWKDLDKTIIEEGLVNIFSPEAKIDFNDKDKKRIAENYSEIKGKFNRFIENKSWIERQNETLCQLERSKCECAGNSFDEIAVEIEVELEETIEQVFTLPDICVDDFIYEVISGNGSFDIHVHQFTSYEVSQSKEGEETVLLCVGDKYKQWINIEELNKTLFVNIDHALEKVKELVDNYEQKQL